MVVPIRGLPMRKLYLALATLAALATFIYYAAQIRRECHTGSASSCLSDWLAWAQGPDDPSTVRAPISPPSPPTAYTSGKNSPIVQGASGDVNINIDN